ncbi:hypothetical protein DERF_013385 [Dermatophagoides farinae]|uniref:Uncharacterized protein n=1 Tax=Dermatophagoides farinae TaxID=6954 RepID=A0A922HMA4_DERFA|nr:hypothetical protein DERF_013385 [Dermatophagoides farinae]
MDNNNNNNNDVVSDGLLPANYDLPESIFFPGIHCIGRIKVALHDIPYHTMTLVI